MKRTAIRSRDNPQFKRLRELTVSARAVREQRQTVLVGAHLVKACLDSGHPLRLWVLAEHALDVAEVRACVAAAADVPAVELNESLFRELTQLPTSQGIAALIDVPSPAAPDTAAAQYVVALDGVQDAGNVGTILRTAAAAGYRAAWLGSGCAGAWSAKVLRAGQGAHFALEIGEQKDLATMLSNHDLPVFGAVAAGGKSLFQSCLTGPHIWVFGSEGDGISAAVNACVTNRVTIPMATGVESLNVAAAAAICLFEGVRQRHSSG